MAINIAQQQILANPVSGFLEGRALRLAEQNEATKMRALERAETRDAETHDLNKRRMEQDFDIVDAKRAYAATQQILSSENAKRTIETQYPEWVKSARDGGLDWDAIDEGSIRTYVGDLARRTASDAGIAPEKAGPLSKEGKIAADVNAGLLTKEQGDSAMRGQVNTPSRIQAYKLAQDQGFAGSYLEFEKQLKGKGFSMTLPDGTVVSMGEPASGVGPGELSKPTINNLQETIVKSTDRLDRLNATLAKYRPEFLQAKGLAKALTTRVQDFLGMDVTEEQRQYLDEYSQFQSSAATDLTQFLKDMNGSAVTPQEYARTEKALPSGKEISPTEFEAKSKVAIKTITRAIMRANWALKNGIGVKSVEQLAKVMPLESIDEVYEQRANEIWQELGGTAESKAQAIKQANQEFGLAR